jgi:hypothetical protein
MRRSAILSLDIFNLCKQKRYAVAHCASAPKFSARAALSLPPAAAGPSPRPSNAITPVSG